MYYFLLQTVDGGWAVVKAFTVTPEHEDFLRRVNVIELCQRQGDETAVLQRWELQYSVME